MQRFVLILSVISMVLAVGCGPGQPGREDSTPGDASAGEQQAERNNGDVKVKHYGGIIKVRPEFEERYVILHQHTWPEVLDRIRKSGIRNYTIFLHEGYLYSHYHYVGGDHEADMAAIAADPVTRDWWKLTDPMQEPLESRKEGEWWASMDILLDDTTGPPCPGDAGRHGYLALLEPGSEEAVRQTFAALARDYSGEAVRAANIRNFAFYLQGRRLFLFVEHCGGSYEADLAALRRSDKYLALERELRPLLKRWGDGPQATSWTEMKEVFHTD